MELTPGCCALRSMRTSLYAGRGRAIFPPPSGTPRADLIICMVESYFSIERLFTCASSWGIQVFFLISTKPLKREIIVLKKKEPFK